MNAKQLFLATSLTFLTAASAFAADTAPAQKTRAEVVAELQEARANGEEIGMEGFSWYPAQKAALVKANETRLAAEKANADKVATAKAQKSTQN
ncbi:DUF4148 domain-containing protein [Undibacterium sp. JH2W]|uniref:DUF4148 domain-containing protein n=1 Tax=Undibacterium sp. JH2W TaxID=3413037 RepID=UPI003BF08DC1